MKVIFLFSLLCLLNSCSALEAFRRLQVVKNEDMHPMQAEDHPASSVGGLRLSKFYHWHLDEPSLLQEHVMEEDEYRRRLELGVYNFTEGCCSLKTERERVRTAAALNFHFYPYAYDELFDDDSGEVAWGKAEIYEKGDALDRTNGKLGATAEERAKNAELYQKKQQSFMASFLTSDALTEEWDPRHYPEDTFNEGSSTATGVAMGVYESSDGEKMIVFRGSYSTGDFDNIVKWIKDWILDRMEQRVKDSYTDMGYELTDEQKARSGGDVQSRCALRAGTTVFTQLHNTDLANNADGITKEDIKRYGYWPITKMMVRQVLPTSRSISSEGPTYITGHSQGGARASLVSMWLEKEDNVKYRTYAMSPVGVSCFSRKLSFLPGSTEGENLLHDVDPTYIHDQIVSYYHPFDFYALMDYQVGTVCKYGTSRLHTDLEGGSDLMHWVDKTVGYTGPELMVDMFQTIPADVFGKTRFWTHSILWMNIIFENATILLPDGTTDGGCSNEVLIPEGDPDKLCPEGDSDATCNALFLGVGVFLFALIVAVPLCCCACTHTCCFKRDKKDNMTIYERTVRPKVEKTVREMTRREPKVAPTEG
ncbi:hypothetical protein TrVE_jg11726 [Triparma verrucosa]|uniref:Fungal lipase-type domain-containing protein n=1 Tax=Triparma verrucosa TaxID=1606542 RepID=A0A9W7BEM8_9STRA|nr:hypothetical protein TrVE_jg11726 [Triparma verrucosa]